MVFGHFWSLLVKNVSKGSILVNDCSYKTVSPSFIPNFTVQTLLVIRVKKRVIMTLEVLMNLALIDVDYPSPRILILAVKN